MGLISTVPDPVINPATVTTPTPTGQTGVIGSTSPTQTLTPAQASSYTTTPDTWKNSSDQTVAGQFNDLTKTDNPLMQQARTGALQQMNSRGLLNSSMAIGAADQAAYNAALPIAQADAAQASKVAGYNVDQFNQASAKNNEIKTNVSLANTQSQNDMLKLQLDSQNKMALAKIEADYKSLIQTSASASDIYNNAMGAISKIYADASIPATGKTQAINGYLTWMQQSMNLVSSINGVNLGSLLNFSNVAVS
jgi:hypothetical protein